MQQRKVMRSARVLPFVSLLALALLAPLAMQGCGSSEDDNVPVATGGVDMATGGAATGGEVAMTGGIGGEMPMTGGSDGSGGSGGTPSTRLPDLLSETGLYEADMATLAPGVRPFRPQFPLWTDGAAKRRWIKLPDGEKIDTSDMNYWEYPVGTKLWKEFSRDDKRIETRLISKRRAGVWDMIAYKWRDDLSEADAVIDGEMNASGTEHDIPSQTQCWDCHNQMADRVLGFTAIQLSHDGGIEIPGAPQDDEWNISLLAEADLLTAPPAAPLELLGTPQQIAALGYMHANCGHCHNPRSATSGRVDMELWLTAEGVADLATSPSVMTTVGEEVSLPEDTPEGATHRISPSNLETSAIYQRFSTKGELYSMPPLGTEMTDPAGETAIREWIMNLPVP